MGDGPVTRDEFEALKKHARVTSDAVKRETEYSQRLNDKVFKLGQEVTRLRAILTILQFEYEEKHGPIEP